MVLQPSSVHGAAPRRAGRRHQAGRLHRHRHVPAVAALEQHLVVVLLVRGIERRVAVIRRERGVGPFSRTLQVPGEIAADRVQANLREGVLCVTMPKAESAKPRKVQVQTAV